MKIMCRSWLAERSSNVPTTNRRKKLENARFYLLFFLSCKALISAAELATSACFQKINSFFLCIYTCVNNSLFFKLQDKTITRLYLLFREYKDFLKVPLQYHDKKNLIYVLQELTDNAIIF